MEPEQEEQTYLESLRRHLHRYPELSGNEEKTAQYIRKELDACSPDRIETGLGGHGLAAIFESNRPGPSIMLRCEMDALPIPDRTGSNHHSEHAEVSHACGHDGHMSIMVGVARQLNKQRPPAGRVILLFQPAEETGEGAPGVITHEFFKTLDVDRTYALHNLPGFDFGQYYIKKGPFAAGSTGLELIMNGWTSHAAYPHEAASPARLIASLVDYSAEMTHANLMSDDYKVATVTWIRLGEEVYGTTPGFGRMGVTLRAARDETLERVEDAFRRRAEEIAKQEKLELTIKRREPFAATVNHPECVSVVKAATRQLKNRVVKLRKPFPWSEDFGHYSEMSDIAMVGIGAGLEQPHLHAPEYDFPDQLIPYATTLFMSILKEEWRRATT